jgi:hypothetical protein
LEAETTNWALQTEDKQQATKEHTYIHYITFHGSKGCGISHTIPGTHIQYNWSYSVLHTHTHNTDNAVNLHYVHKPLRGWVLDTTNSSTE